MKETIGLLLLFLLVGSKIGKSLHHNIYDAASVKGTNKHSPRIGSGILSPGREKRNDAVKGPMYVTPNQAYLQSNYAYQLPCTIVKPGDPVTVISWLRGGSPDPASQKLILRQAFPDDGSNFAASLRYQLSSTYDIIISPVVLNDTDRYWCRTDKSSDKSVDDYLDVTVIDSRLPAGSISSTTNFSASYRYETHNKINCPALSQTESNSDVTLYWSVLSYGDKTLHIVFAKFTDGEVLTFDPYAGRYSLENGNSLAVEKFQRRKQTYCCHVFKEGTDMQASCVEITWLATVVRYPSISGCDSTDGNTCHVTLTPNQDCARLECSIQDIYPKPDLNWSFTECDGGTTPIFIVTASSTNNSVTQTYGVSTRLYVVELQTDEVCKFACTAEGEAIMNGTSMSNVVITSLGNDTTPLVIRDREECICGWAAVVLLTMLMTALLCILIIGVVLIFPRNRKFIQNHVNDFPTFSCLIKDETDAAHQDTEMVSMKPVTDAEESARNTVLDASSSSKENDEDHENQVETSPMLTIEDEDKDVSDVVNEGPLCLVIRGDPDVLITDSKNKWRPMGEFVTESALADENGSGFQAIRDVICTQDGDLFVIDACGLHHFTPAYNYHFVDLNEILGNESYCSVAHHSGNKLLFGLSRGKIVQFDIQDGQVSNFSSVTRVRYTDVHLADISVDNLGFVFAGDRNGKAVSMFDDDGGCLTRMEIGIEPMSLCAYARNELQSLFVSSGVAVKKYNIVKSSTNAKILAQVRFTIDREFLTAPNFHSGYVTVQEGKLFVVNHLEVGEYLQVLEHDSSKGTKEHSFVVDLLGLRGVKFMETDTMVVYTDDAVYLFERGGSPLEESPKW